MFREVFCTTISKRVNSIERMVHQLLKVCSVDLHRISFNDILSGIGQGRITQNLQDAPIDESLFISDQDSVNMV